MATKRLFPALLLFLLFFGLTLITFGLLQSNPLAQANNKVSTSAKTSVVIGKTNIETSPTLNKSNEVAPPSGPSYSLVGSNTIANGHTAPVIDVAFSPDGTTLATASTDTLIKLWRVSNNGNFSVQTQCTLFNFPYPLASLAFSPDSKILASGDINGHIKLWNMPCVKGGSPNQPIDLADLQGSIRAVIFSHDGRYLADGGADNILHIWDLASHQQVASFDNSGAGINDVRWSPDDSQLAFVSTRGKVVLLAFDSTNKTLTQQNSLDAQNGALRSLVWSGDGKWLAAGDSAGGITVWYAANSTLFTRFTVAKNDIGILTMAFSSDNSTLAEGAGDNSVKLWKITADSNGKPQITAEPVLQAHQGPVRGVAFSPDGKIVASSADDHVVLISDVASGKLLGSLNGTASSQTTVNWSNDGSLVSGSNSGTIRAWQAATVQQTAQVSGVISGSVWATALSPDNKWLAAVGNNGQLGLWRWPIFNAETAAIASTVSDSPSLAVAFAPNSKQLATAGEDGKLQLWNWDGTILRTAALTTANLRPVRTLSFSPDGKFIATGSDDGVIRLWNSQNLQLIKAFPAQNGYIKKIAVDRSGKILASAAGDGSVRIWNVETASQISAVEYQTVVEALALSSDGQTIAVSTDDGAIHLYRVADNRPYFTIFGYGLTALDLAFAPNDSQRLAAVTADGSIQIWNLNLSNVDATQPALPTPPTLTPLTNNFVTIQNGHLSLNNQPVKLKGFNFYPHLAPWSSMWTHWNGPQVAADLDKAQAIGTNALRILVPYGTGYAWTKADGTPQPEMLNELDQLIAMAANRNMRVLLTLYDFYGNFPLAGTPEEAANWRYLDAIVSRYQNDPRVLGWDLHNEPDNYQTWKSGDQEQVMDWLERVSVRIRQHDPNHFITIGMGVPSDFMTTNWDGLDILALSDVVGLHAYTASLIEQQVSAIRAVDGPTPLILEEFGWPSGPTELNSDYSEAAQAQRVQTTLDEITKLNIDGGLAWMLWDFMPDSIINLRPNITEQYFGFVRVDGSLKPAAQIWQQSYQPSSLAVANPANAPNPSVRAVDPNLYPQYFPQTGFAVATPFKEYWNQMGGLASFGYPISGVFWQNGYIVQYFERARFEYHPANTLAPDYAGLSHSEQLKRVVLLGLMGHEWLQCQKRSFSAATPQPGQTFYSQTKHNLGGVFLQYWQTHGGLFRFGYPISEPIQEVNPTDGKTYTVQYFERARFEYHPEFSGTDYVVELGQLGRELLNGCPAA